MENPWKLVCALIAMLGFAQLCQGQESNTVGMTMPTSGDDIERHLVDSPEENQNCIMDDDPLETNSEGLPVETVNCVEGERRGSTERPCPPRKSCCSCGRGSYQPTFNTCDRCIRHSICHKYAFYGNSTHDAVCNITDSTTVLPTTITPITRGISCHEADLPAVQAGYFNCSGYSVGDRCNLTCDDGLYPSSSKETVCGDRDDFEGNWTVGDFRCSESNAVLPDRTTTITTTVRDRGGGTKFSIQWPWSIIVLIIIAVLLLVALTAFLLIFTWHRRHTGEYNPAPQDDNMQLCPVGNNNGAPTSPPDPPESGNIPVADGGLVPGVGPVGNGRLPSAAGATSTECAIEMSPTKDHS